MSSSEERSEKPTANRLRKAREHGDVAFSRTLITAVSFGSSLIALVLLGDMIRDQLADLLIYALTANVLNDTDGSLIETIRPMARHAANVVLPFLLTLIIASLLCGLVQTRGLFSVKSLSFQLSRINPGQQLQQRFSTMQLFDFFITLIKFALICGVVYWVVLRSFDGLVSSLFDSSIWNSVASINQYLLLLIAGATFIFLIAGIVDYMHRHFQYIKRNQMTKSEVKQEQRDLYGDPTINAHLRQKREELSTGGTPKRKIRPSVIVTNPTHFAVALFFDPDVVEVPIVVGKARDRDALDLRAAALKEGIPVAERPPLARRLHRTLAVGQPIHEDEFESVAEVFRWLKSAD